MTVAGHFFEGIADTEMGRGAFELVTQGLHHQRLELRGWVRREAQVLAAEIAFLVGR